MLVGHIYFWTQTPIFLLVWFSTFDLFVFLGILEAVVRTISMSVHRIPAIMVGQVKTLLTGSSASVHLVTMTKSATATLTSVRPSLVNMVPARMGWTPTRVHVSLDLRVETVTFRLTTAGTTLASMAEHVQVTWAIINAPVPQVIQVSTWGF